MGWVASLRKYKFLSKKTDKICKVKTLSPCYHDDVTTVNHKECLIATKAVSVNDEEIKNQIDVKVKRKTFFCLILKMAFGEEFKQEDWKEAS